MGCWGMGLAQTDEFCEVYDNFMEEYDEGKPVAEITAEILAKYHEEFDDDDGIMHDIYFALAKAEWMCKEQSEAILARVKEIIETKANIEFYRELETTESDLKIRQRNLEKFWNMLQTPREKARKRKRTAPPAEKALPPIEVGDCFAYKYEEGFRVICILERYRPRPNSEDTVSVALFEKIYSAEELKNTDFLQENIGKTLTVTAAEFLGKSVIKKIAHIEISPESRSFFNLLYETKQSFRTEISKSLGITLQELFHHFKENTDEAMQNLEIGGCYAYKYKNGYRFAIVLDRTEFDGKPHWMIAVLSAFSDTLSTDFLHTDISAMTMYDKEAVPNLADWKRVDSVDVPPGMLLKLFGKNRYIIGEIFDFFHDLSKIHNELWTLRRLAPILDCCKENTKEAFDKLETYGLYAYQDVRGPRLALILDRFLSPCGEELVLVALLFKTPFSAYGDYMNYGISHVGIYSRETLPNTEGWVWENRMIPNETACTRIKAYTAKYGKITIECHRRFFSKPYPHSIEGVTLSLGRFLRIYFEEK